MDVITQKQQEKKVQDETLYKYCIKLRNDNPLASDSRIFRVVSSMDSVGLDTENGCRMAFIRISGNQERRVINGRKTIIY